MVDVLVDAVRLFLRILGALALIPVVVLLPFFFLGALLDHKLEPEGGLAVVGWGALVIFGQVGWIFWLIFQMVPA